MVLRSLMRVLSSAGHQVRGYGSSEDFLAHGAAGADGCIVMDMCLPGMTGLDLQKHLVSKGCRQPIVFVTGKADVVSTVQAMRAGALNFLLKPVEAETLIGSVDEALRRNAVECRSRDRRDHVLQRLATLTPRERQVFVQVVNGRMNKQIAAEFGVGEKTIKVHRGRVMHKMGAQTIAQLVRMAEQIQSPADSDIDGVDTLGHDTPAREHAATRCPSVLE